ncbi:uncharacterized protein LOC102713009 [Oryza brachyantha]|uniref:Uncharacterized protein n=1 Tax=Oryza brachyantha TaxID=4533 RepID=J3MK51_ORYBR|nr:uncharacterized protein LOC102713009 [Oryza brachyantha]XP_015694972.1 uncharacterized protein LOC102713009 [Oryza brachyantha]
MASEQMSTTPAHAKREKGAAASSSSSPSSEEEIDEDDFFHIEGPILSTQYSLSVPPAAADEDGGGAARSAERPDPKRIPSSVFARSKSTTPTDWSVTSNESLFSINVGNASFSKDHLFLYGKTGELGNLNDPLPPLPKLSPSSSPMKGGEVAAAAEKASTSREKAGGRGLADRNGEDSADYVHSSSHRSDESTTSFAFPILTGSAKTSGSLKDSHPELARQSTAQLTHPADTRSENDNKETAVVVMEAPKVEQAPAPAVAAAAASPPPPQPPATTKWFPCCSCCPFCC